MKGRNKFENSILWLRSQMISADPALFHILSKTVGGQREILLTDLIEVLNNGSHCFDWQVTACIIKS
ncbi:unnamed protein product [Litomosoides sigmodontis]|uniref:Uncharacterized protein n=1 Tax=Litomosoides sigmodontis TaxID=42156 RepID=A0A3P6SMZ7_LITSI|nr:unnamed protein product [Litomosoides sigmodontis]